MITTILLLATLALTAFYFFSTKDQAYEKIDPTGRWDSATEKFRPIWLIKGLAIFLVGLLIVIIQPFAIERVDAGHVGIKVNLTGNSRGVSKYEYKTGWVLYNTWTETMYEFPTYQQHIEFGQQQVITKGGFPADIKPSFNYSLKPNAVGDMFQNLRLPIKDVEQGWLKNAIVGAVNDVANTWEVDSIFGHRQAFESAIVSECNIRLSKWFEVSQMRSNIIPPDALQDAIVAKTRSVQQAEASIQQALAAKADGERKIAVAKADSAETIINASAAAKAIQLKQDKLSPLYIEYIKWTNASKDLPRVPSTVVGSGAGALLNIK
jgi:regulator of protease activity HflC (stomatin/prohibitin superfamily)